MFFETRVRHYIKDGDKGVDNVHYSPVFNMLNVCARFGLLEVFVSMVLGKEAVMGKKAWSKAVWAKAWNLDDA